MTAAPEAVAAITPGPVPHVREEDAAGAVIIIKELALVKVAARRVAGYTRTRQLAHERGPAAAAAQAVQRTDREGVWRRPAR